jgi:hypothetical protein
VVGNSTGDRSDYASFFHRGGRRLLYTKVPRGSSTAGSSSTRSSSVKTKGNRTTNRQKEADKKNEIERTTQLSNTPWTRHLRISHSRTPLLLRHSIRKQSGVPLAAYHSQYGSWHRGHPFLFHHQQVVLLRGTLTGTILRHMRS